MATITWNDVTTNDWDLLANWDVRIPLSTDDVVIPAAAATPPATRSLGGTRTVKSISLAVAAVLPFVNTTLNATVSSLSAVTVELGVITGSLTLDTCNTILFTAATVTGGLVTTGTSSSTITITTLNGATGLISSNTLIITHGSSTITVINDAGATPTIKSVSDFSGTITVPDNITLSGDTGLLVSGGITLGAGCTLSAITGFGTGTVTFGGNGSCVDCIFNADMGAVSLNSNMTLLRCEMYRICSCGPGLNVDSPKNPTVMRVDCNLQSTTTVQGYNCSSFVPPGEGRSFGLEIGL